MNSMKKRMMAAVSGMVIASSLLSSAAVAMAGETETEAPVYADYAEVKVALVLPGSANDKGWNQEAYEGLEKMKEEGFTTSCSENVAASDYETVYRGYADQGFQIVIGHGTEFEDTAEAVAEDYPDTTFVVTSSDIYQEPNVCSLQNLNNEQGFIAGVVAALATTSKKVAAIGGMEIPSIQSYIMGFEQGVAYADDSVEAMTAFTGDFNDATKVKEQATAFIQQGADIVSQDADEAGLGLFEAIKDTPDGTYAIGAVKDQYEECPGKVLTSATNAIGDAMVVAAETYAKEGKLDAKCYKYGIAEGTIGLADWHDCADVLTDDEKTFVQETMDKIASGEIKVESAQS